MDVGYSLQVKVKSSELLPALAWSKSVTRSVTVCDPWHQMLNSLVPAYMSPEVSPSSGLYSNGVKLVALTTEKNARVQSPPRW